MSIRDSQDWAEIERRARAAERHAANNLDDLVQSFGLKIEVSDRLRGCIVESLSMLEAGHTAAAQQVLEDALKIRGEL